jgi:ATP-dependent DNA helicase RecQ
VTGYLVEFLTEQGHLTPEPWLDEQTFATVAAAVKEVGAERLKPIFDQLNGTIEYDHIRIAVACLRNA